MASWRLAAAFVLSIAASILLTIAVYTYLNYTNAQHYYSLGLKALNEGNYTKAIEYFIRSLSYDPNNWRAWYELGVALSEPDLFHRYYKICGESFTDSGHPAMQVLYELSIWAFSRCAAVNGKCKPLADFGIANARFDYYCYYTNRKKYIVPLYLDALRHIDVVRRYLGREGVAALYTNLARVYLSMAEIDKARQYYIKAINIYPIDTAVEHLMWVELERGNYTGVLKLMKFYVSRWSYEADLALAPAAWAALSLGRYDLATKYAKEIVEKFPSSDYVGEAYRLLAIVALREGDIRKAIEYLKKDVETCSEVLNIASFPMPGEVPGAFYERGIAYLMLANITGNKTYLEKAMRDFEWLVNHPKISCREVAHRNYYIYGSIALAITYAKMRQWSNALKVLNNLIYKINTDPNLVGWRKLLAPYLTKLLEEIKSHKVPRLPKLVIELEH